MSTITITTPRVKHSGETRNVGVSLSGCLDSGETLTGTPTVVDGASVLTLSGKLVTTATMVIDGVTVPIAEAVTFRVAGGVAGTDYTITITCGTSASQTVVRKIPLRVSDS